MALLGLTVADTQHILNPTSPFHRPILQALPGRLMSEWQEILTSRSSTEVLRILESTKNRMAPFYNSDILQPMFASSANRLDVRRFRADRRIVVVNLAPMGQLSPQEQDAIASLLINDVLADARSRPKGLSEPTYLWLDEFQRCVGPDLEFAIPEVRQMGIKLAALAHQSFAQLKRGPDCDLTPFIWVPRTRFVFGLAAEDADLEANEFAALTYDPKKIKDEIYSLRQLEVGKKKVELASWGTTCATARQWQEVFGQGWSTSEHTSRRLGSPPSVLGSGTARSRSRSDGHGGSESQGSAHSVHEQLISELATILERSSTTYYTYDEHFREWGRNVRELRTGQCIILAVNDPVPRRVQVFESRPSFLAFPPEVILRRFPKEVEAMHALLAKNFESGLFVTPAQIERETHERLQRVLRPAIAIHRQDSSASPPGESPFL
jgi:hypothetical protein